MILQETKLLLGKFDELLSFVDVSDNMMTFVATTAEICMQEEGLHILWIFTNHLIPC